MAKYGPENLSSTSDQNIMWFSLPYMYFRPELLSLSNGKITYLIQDPGARKHKILLYFLGWYIFWEIPWKFSDDTVLRFWWICTSCALAAKAWLSHVGRHKEVTIATCKQQPYKIVHQLSHWFTGQNHETNTCTWNVFLTFLNLNEIFV